MELADDPYSIEPTFTHSTLLQDLEEALRNPENNRSYLIAQLRTLAEVVDQNGTGEHLNGLCLGALGGIYHCVQRLLQGAPMITARSPEYFADAYAQAELSAFADTQERLQANLQRFAAEYTFVGVTPHVGLDNVTRYAFVSMRKQTTRDGRVLADGELVDAFDRLAAPWKQVIQQKE